MNFNLCIQILNFMHVTWWPELKQFAWTITLPKGEMASIHSNVYDKYSIMFFYFGLKLFQEFFRISSIMLFRVQLCFFLTSFLSFINEHSNREVTKIECCFITLLTIIIMVQHNSSPCYWWYTIRCLKDHGYMLAWWFNIKVFFAPGNSCQGTC